MQDPWEDAELARRFDDSSTMQRLGAPLYAALNAGIARDPELYRLLHHAPPEQRLPVLLLACVHSLVIAEPDHELAQWYPNLTADHRSPTDPALLRTFKQFVAERAVVLVDLLSTRTTQTNEVGRCLLLLPALGVLGAEIGPLAHLDVGTSGGLNLLFDRYAYRYEPSDGGEVRTVGEESPVQLTAGIRGALPIPATMPVVAARCGIDRRPIDVTDDGEAHWLEACVWPDQRERYLRLHAAIAIARAEPPEILAGDAVSSLDPAIARMARAGHPVVTNSWVLNYLSLDDRTAYVHELDRIGATTDLSWISVESPAMTPGLPWEADFDDPERTVLTLVRWREGRRRVEHLATCHPHGRWLHALG